MKYKDLKNMDKGGSWWGLDLVFFFFLVAGSSPLSQVISSKRLSI